MEEKNLMSADVDIAVRFFDALDRLKADGCIGCFRYVLGCFQYAFGCFRYAFHALYNNNLHALARMNII